MRTKWLVIILLIVSAVVHFAYFGQPNETVFDEVHFGKFVSGYYTHQYFFDIHPPLGKLMIAGFGKLFDFKPEFSFAEIGQEFPDKTYLALRFLPTLAGTLLPIIIFFLCLQLGLRPLASFFAGLFIALENALLVQSRSILLDLFLLDFGFLALYFYFKYRNSGTYRSSLILMSIFGALAVSVKWTGLTFLALPLILELRKQNFKLKKILKLFLIFVVIPFVIYFSIFSIHFSLLSRSGEGDAFMTPEFRKTLIGSSDPQNPDIRPLNLFHKFTELNIEMYRANQRLTTPHSYGSQWYTWPFMLRTIYYWNMDTPNAAGETGRIYLLGNPIIWWTSTFALIMLIGKILAKEIKFKGVPVILIGGYFLNLLPFIGIGRVMFLYHYFSALIFALLALAWLIDQSRHSRRTFYILTACAAVAFIYFAPLSYGLPLSPAAYEQHNWLQTWK